MGAFLKLVLVVGLLSVFGCLPCKLCDQDTWYQLASQSGELNKQLANQDNELKLFFKYTVYGCIGTGGAVAITVGGSGAKLGGLEIQCSYPIALRLQQFILIVFPALHSV